MRTIAPKTTCAKPINNATYATRLTACTSVSHAWARNGRHLVGAMIHLHVIVARFDSVPRRDEKCGERDRGHDCPNELRQRRAGRYECRILHSPLRDDRSQNGDL